MRQDGIRTDDVGHREPIPRPWRHPDPISDVLHRYNRYQCANQPTWNSIDSMIGAVSAPNRDVTVGAGPFRPTGASEDYCFKIVAGAMPIN
jgi:hypothetical protein